MSWPFETSEPFVTPGRAVEFARRRRGLTPEEWALPPTLVATFQRAAYERLLECAGPHPEGNQAGNSRGSDPAVGAVGGIPVALARISVGAPAAALVLEECIARGACDLLIVGSAGSLQPHLPIGSTAIVEGAEREDGTSHHYLPADEVVATDPELTRLLEERAMAQGGAPARGRSWTIDAPFRETVGAIRRHREAGVAVVEMEAAAIFAVARVRGARAALIVAVSDELFDREWQIGLAHDAYVDALRRAADTTIDAAATLR